MYRDEFRSAVQRTKRLGLDWSESVQLDEGTRFLNDENVKRFPYVLRDAAGYIPPEKIAAQCFAVHAFLKGVVERWLGCPAYFTIGWVEDGKGGLFRFDESYIVDKLRSAKTDTVLNAHAWLTLPSLEIIDLSLATTLVRVFKDEDLRGRVILSHADSLLQGVAYKPMLIGDDYLCKLGLLREFTVYS